jgi:hypothetical protein
MADWAENAAAKLAPARRADIKRLCAAAGRTEVRFVICISFRLMGGFDLSRSGTLLFG